MENQLITVILIIGSALIILLLILLLTSSKLKSRQHASINAKLNKALRDMQVDISNISKFSKEITGITKIEHTGNLTKAHTTDAAFDLHTTKDFTLSRGYQKIIPTGVRIALPEYYEAQVRPRSGLSAKYKLGVTNSPGTIDSGYRGEVKVILINHGNNTVYFKKGDRIAQLVITKLPKVCNVAISDEKFSKHLNTPRSEGGFGSTGVK